jgi:hypothetical protein
MNINLLRALLLGWAASSSGSDREPSRLIAIPELFIEARRALRICSPQLL